MSEFAEQLRQRTFRYGLRIITFCRQELPETWQTREIGKHLLRSGMGVSRNYWAACRGISDTEFIDRLGVATDQAEQSVLWLTAIVQSGINQDADTKALLKEAQELRAILSQSRRTAQENRRKRRSQAAKNVTAVLP